MEFIPYHDVLSGRSRIPLLLTTDRYLRRTITRPGKTNPESLPLKHWLTMGILPND